MAGQVLIVGVPVGLLLLQIRPALFHARAYNGVRALHGLLREGQHGVVQIEKLRPLILLFFVQRQDVVLLCPVGAHVHPGGQRLHALQVHGAVGILFKGDGEQNAVLRIVGRRSGNIAVSLVGHGVAQGVDDHGLVALVNGAGEKIHRLHHMGVSAHDHVKAQVAQLLRHGVLKGVLFNIVFHAPVNEHHGGFRAVRLHLLQNLLRRGVQLVGVIVEKVVHLPLVLDGGKTVEGEGGAVAAICPGVAHHADLDAVHVHHGVLRLVGVQLGA